MFSTDIYIYITSSSRKANHWQWGSPMWTEVIMCNVWRVGEGSVEFSPQQPQTVMIPLQPLHLSMSACTRIAQRQKATQVIWILTISLTSHDFYIKFHERYILIGMDSSEKCRCNRKMQVCSDHNWRVWIIFIKCPVHCRSKVVAIYSWLVPITSLRTALFLVLIHVPHRQLA